MSPRAQRYLRVSHPVFDGNEKAYVNECLDTTWISSQGRFIGEFERAFASYCGANHAVACSNGTTALHLALLALGVQPGDEVISPTVTFVSTANAIRYCGAIPVFADSEPRTMNIDPRRIEEKITPRTKGIVAVHLYGHPCDMDPIAEIARRHRLFVLEDAAEAHGARYKGRRTGALSDAAIFSFFGNKIITCGEGGILTTSNPEVEQRARLLRGQGMDPSRRYWFPEVGYNYRMTNVAAAIGLAQLERIGQRLDDHRRVADFYHRHLAPLEKFLELPVEESWAEHVYWLYTIRLRQDSPHGRDEVMRRLDEAGIETRPVFYPMHIMPPYREPDGSYPIAESVARRGISLPTNPLVTSEDVAYIAGRLAAILGA